METQKIVIYHSNDIHSRLENSAKIATIIQNGRREYGINNVIAVDIGDHMDRARMETEGTDGLLHRAIIEETKYDLVTIGNNEGLTFTREQLDEIYGNGATFNVICSNFHALDEVDPSWLLPHYIKVQNGIRIGFIAATACFQSFYMQMGWKVEEPIAAIQQQIDHIRNEVDVVILLSHLGIRLDEEIARRNMGVDIILGAHTHHLLDPPNHIENTLVCAAGKFGMYVGKVTIEFNPDEKRFEYRGECIPTAAFQEDDRILKIIHENAFIAKQNLQKSIVTLTQPMQASYTNETPLPNLLAIGLKKWCNAEIGLVNTGQLLAGLAIGEVTAGEIHALCPSPINPCKMLLKGEQLLEALEQSLLPEFMNMKIVGFGFRGEQLGTLAVDGLEIDYDEARPDLHKIISVTVNGVPLNNDQEYEVGTIDMFTFKVGYHSLAQSLKAKYYLPEFIRHIIAKELIDGSSVEASYRKRWHSIS